MATNRWLGRAQAQKQITTIAVTGTWATGDDATLTINGKSVTVTVGSDVATTDIVDILVAAWNGEALVNDESRNVEGDDLVEFNEITASDSGSTLTLTHDTAGVPFTVTVSETTAGDGALGSPTNSQSATGPNDVNSAANWSNAAVPANGDDIYIDNTAVSLLWNLDALSAVTLTSLNIGASFEGDIGLPKTSSAGYPEYRPDYWEISATTVNIGYGEGLGSGRIKLNLGSAQATVEIKVTGSALEQGLGALILKGTHASNVLEVQSGSVSVAPFGGEAATLVTVRNVNGQVDLGEGCTLTTVEHLGGALLLSSALTTLNQYGGEVLGRGSGAVTTLSVHAGTCRWGASGTITTLNVGGRSEPARFVRDGDLSPITVTNANLKPNGSIEDGGNTITYTNNIAPDSAARIVQAA